MSTNGERAAPTPPDPSPGRPPTPAAFTLSCLFGAIGLVVLVAGLVTSSDAVAVAGMVAGALSLAAALYWRSELVRAWAERKRSGPG